MISPVFHRRHVERFAQLLDGTDEARHHGTRSPLDDELVGLVDLGHRLSAAQPDVDANPEFRTDLRAMLVATAEREGIGATAAPTGESLGPSGRPQPAVNPHRLRTRGAIIAAVAVGAVAVSGISTASDNSLPGDALYPMKRSTERAHLALSGSDFSRGQLFLDFARTRLNEAEALRGDEAGFLPLLDEMDADTRAGVKLLTAVAVQDNDHRPLDTITAFLAQQSEHLQDVLDDATGVGHKRLVTSDALLNTIAERVEFLQRTLACGSDPSGQADALGPLPRDCPADGGSAGGTPGTGQQGQRLNRQAAAPPNVSPAQISPTPDGSAPSVAGRARAGNTTNPAGRAIPTPSGTTGRPFNQAQG